MKYLISIMLYLVAFNAYAWPDLKNYDKPIDNTYCRKYLRDDGGQYYSCSEPNKRPEGGIVFESHKLFDTKMCHFHEYDIKNHKCKKYMGDK